MQIVVLGMHRSGTSSLTHLLHEAGAYFGPDGISTGQSWENPKGFWERRDARQACDLLLQKSGFDWWKVDGFSVDAIPEEVRAEGDHQFAAIVSELDAHRPWVIKEPRLCLLMPVLSRHLDDPVAVVAIRHPWEVARSLRARNNIPEDVGMALWSHYTRSALLSSEACPRILVDYNALVLEPAEIGRKLVTDLRRVTDDRLVLSETAVESVIEPHLRRQTDAGVPDAMRDHPAIRLHTDLLANGLDIELPPVTDAENASLRVFEALGGLPALQAKSRQEATDRKLNEISGAVKKETGQVLSELGRTRSELRDLAKSVETEFQHHTARTASDREQSAQTQQLLRDLIARQDKNAKDQEASRQRLQAQEKAHKLEVKRLQQQARSQRAEMARLRADRDHKARKLQQVRSSTTWRLGGPVRVLGRLLRGKTLSSASSRTARGQRSRNGLGHDTAPIAAPYAGTTRSDGRTTSVSSTGPTREPAVIREGVDVIVPVHNALEDTKRCLVALKRYNDGMSSRIIVVNDGSDDHTTSWLKQYCKAASNVELINIKANRGYTTAINTGLAQTDARYVVLLNSDTIVTEGWLAAMIECADSNDAIGIVGPLSNAATWQSVPELLDSQTGKFAINQLPNGINPDQMSSLVTALSPKIFPRTPFVNGFCYLIKREVITAVGDFDVENFPVGYGEENDYSIRTADAGYELAIADNAYVYHAKSKSFGHERRKQLSGEGMAKLKEKHGDERVTALIGSLKASAPLDPLRDRLKTALAEKLRADRTWLKEHPARILFLLPAGGGGGGAHSIVQEVAAMRRAGVYAHIALKQEHLPRYRDLYADMEGSEALFVGCTPEEFAVTSGYYDVVVATIYSSVELLEEILRINPHLVPAYYVQDYEPFFFEDEAHPERRRALDSYERIPGMLIFAKTDWLVRTVETNHSVRVRKVQPSIDHSVYAPLRGTRSEDAITLAAMIRPRTPRRGAARTMRVLAALAARSSRPLSIRIFGCESESPAFLQLERNFDFTNYGVLKRPQVASLLAECDLFLDLSDYQAFGRTALEAMACGASAVVPALGGVHEYAVDGENALIVDTRNEAEIVERILELLGEPDRLRAMQANALGTASRYSVEDAARSELAVIESAFEERIGARPAG